MMNTVWHSLFILDPGLSKKQGQFKLNEEKNSNLISKIWEKIIYVANGNLVFSKFSTMWKIIHILLVVSLDGNNAPL